MQAEVEAREAKLGPAVIVVDLPRVSPADLTEALAAGANVTVHGGGGGDSGRFDFAGEARALYDAMWFADDGQRGRIAEAALRRAYEAGERAERAEG